MPGREREQNLAATSSVTMGASLTATTSVGPDDGKGPANWAIDTVLWQTTRPGVAPVPRLQVYQDSTDPGGIQVNSYDGSFGQAVGELTISRGNKIIAVWTGGQAGDVCSITVTGKKW